MSQFQVSFPFVGKEKTRREWTVHFIITPLECDDLCYYCQNENTALVGGATGRTERDHFEISQISSDHRDYPKGSEEWKLIAARFHTALEPLAAVRHCHDMDHISKYLKYEARLLESLRL